MAVRKNTSPVFECIATSLDDALVIEQFGGQRIELVSALSEGGFTPNEGLIKAVLDRIKIPVAVMLRPNKASFHYSPNDLREMKNDINRFGQIGVRHIVTGMLDGDGITDIKSLEQLLRDTDVTVTFHRAIDECSDIERSLQRINDCHRITHILTSLGRGSVIDNLDRLEWYAVHSRPRLILAGGITHKNALQIFKAARRLRFDVHLGKAIRHNEAMRLVDPYLVDLMKDILER